MVISIKNIIKSFLRLRHPLVRQYDIIDCGPAALLSILKYYGGNASLVYMRDLCKVDANGATMLDLVNGAKTLGFQAYGATGEFEDLRKQTMPCIAHVVLEGGLNHFIVIYKINSRNLYVGDPGKGKYKIKKENFLRIWQKKAVVLLKPEGVLYDHAPPGWITWITGYVQKFRAWVYQTVFLGIFHTALGLTTAVFVQWLIDRFIPERDLNKILYTSLFLLSLLIIRSFAGYFRERFIIILNKKISININSDFLDHIFGLPKRFFDTRKTGDITARINDSMSIQKAILLIMNISIIDSLIILASFALMFHLAPVLAWLSLIFIPIYFFILLSKVKKIKTDQNEVMKSHAAVESAYIDSLKGIDDIIGFNVSKAFAERNRNLFGYFQVRFEKLGFTQTNLSLSGELLSTFLTVLLLSCGAVLVIRDQLMLGQMVAAYSLMAHILPSINRFIEANILLQGANIATHRLRDILLVDQEKQDAKQAFVIKNKLTVQNACFAWPKSRMLFQGLNLTIEKGKLTSLLGNSGTGKSTLVQLIQQKYPLSEGLITVDETPVQQFGLVEYRRSIAVVPQKIQIFNGTILENIVMGREIQADDENDRKISQSGLDIFTSKFDQGLMTLLGEDGRKLSGGEMQVLALFRALYDDPEILIIDEGFNAMDIEIENLVFNTVKLYAEKHAVLVITHNLRTILKTDKVDILDNGQIIESGNPKELILQNTSHFQKRYKLHSIDDRMVVSFS